MGRTKGARSDSSASTTKNRRTLEKPVWSSENHKKLSEYKPGSAQKGLWICATGHSWLAAIRKVLQQESNCPYCQNKTLLTGFNDIKTLFSDHAKLYSSKNYLESHEILATTVKDFIWECDCGEEWRESAFKFTKRNIALCYECCNKETSTKVSIATQRPDLTQMLKDSTDSIVSIKDRSTDLPWICETGHNFLRNPASMNRSSNCPYCSDREIIVGENDLATTHPYLANEWIDESPITTFTKRNSYIAKWKCSECSHIWETAIYNRAGIKKSDCPRCASSGTSRQEIELFEFLTSILKSTDVDEPKVLANYRKLENVSEIDCYVPSLNIAFEYNGLYWHSLEKKNEDKNYHENKWRACKSVGVSLYQIWEDDWVHKRDIVEKNIIKQLGIDHYLQSLKHFEPKLIENHEAKNFIESNHLLGYKETSHHYGLKHVETKELIAVLSTNFKESELSLVRYSSISSNSKIFTKLLEFSINDSTPNIVSMITDRCIDHGSLLLENGFEHVDSIHPNFKYILKGIRRSKDDTALEKLSTESMSKLASIYDAGYDKWSRNI